MRYLLSILALFAALAIGTQVRADEVPGVTEDRVVIGTITALTGPIAFIGQQYIAEAGKDETPRLAVVYQDDDMGQDGLKGLREAAAHYGLPIVAEESYKRGAIEFGTQSLNMRRAAPTHVVLLTILRSGAAIMKEAHQAGWKPQFIGWLPNAEARRSNWRAKRPRAF